MSSILPIVPSDAHNEFSVTLDNATYSFEFHWNTRDESWYFTMYDSDQTVVIAGVRVVLGTFLGRRSAHPFFERNILVAIDTTLENRDATFDDFGVRVLLKHMTVEDYAHELVAT